jgi:hypothetical protein
LLRGKGDPLRRLRRHLPRRGGGGTRGSGCGGGGFSGGFEVAGLDGGAAGVVGGGGLVHVGGGGEGLLGDVLELGLVLEGGVVGDGCGAGGVDGLDLGRRVLVVGGVDDGVEVGEGDGVHLADLDGGVGGVEEVVHQLGRKRGTCHWGLATGGRGGRRERGVLGGVMVGVLGVRMRCAGVVGRLAALRRGRRVRAPGGIALRVDGRDACGSGGWLFKCDHAHGLRPLVVGWVGRENTRPL